MPRRRLSGFLLLVKIKLLNFIGKSFNLPAPLFYRYHDASALGSSPEKASIMKVFSQNCVGLQGLLVFYGNWQCPCKYLESEILQENHIWGPWGEGYQIIIGVCELQLKKN